MENTDWNNENIPMHDLPTQEDENYDDNYNEDDDNYNDNDETQETSFTDPNFDPENIRSGFRDTGRAIGVEMRKLTQNKKNFLRDHLGIFINKGDGTNSKKLFDTITITTSKKLEVNGMEFNGVKIVVKKGGKFVYSNSVVSREYVEKFKTLVQKVEREHYDNVNAVVENEIQNPSDELTRSVVNETIENLENYIDDQYESLQTQVGNLVLDKNEPREVSAILEGGINRQNINDKQRIDLLDGEIEHYTKLADETTDTRKSRFFRSIARVAQLERDSIRMKMGLKPESDLASEILDEEIATNDLSRFERFKDFVKRNFGVIAGVVIGLGGIITSVVIGVRGVVKSAGKTIGDLAKGVAKIVKNVGPLVGAVLGLVANILGATAKAVTWLSKNFWLLVVLLIVYLFDRYGKNKRHKSQ